ncbi:MAG: hypothetical protein FWE84_00560 [Firmicutes bacterium]|nr:hypothetical protein [Bacillota bacterium]
MGDHSISVKGESFGRCPAPQQIIFGMFALLTGSGFDEVHMGVVLGDSMYGSTFNEKLVEVCRNAFIPRFPKIFYPIQEVCKEAIYLTLQGYDELIGTNFIKNLTCCESVKTPCDKIKECQPCKTQLEVFKRLKWVCDPPPKKASKKSAEKPRDANNL